MVQSNVGLVIKWKDSVKCYWSSAEENSMDDLQEVVYEMDLSY